MASVENNQVMDNRGVPHSTFCLLVDKYLMRGVYRADRQ